MRKAINQEQGEVHFKLEVIDDDDIKMINPEHSGGGIRAQELTETISNRLEEVSNTISTACLIIQNNIIEKNEQVDKKSKIAEISIEFGISLLAKGGVFITSFEGGATLKVTATLKFD